MGDRAALISLFIKEGVSDPKVMRRLYDEGGNTGDIKPAAVESSYPREREVLDLVNNSKADFVSRLADENRLTIPDWKNKDNIATHKLSYAKDGDRWVIYPNVQNIDGKLYDFSDPQYGLDKGWAALDSALYSGDYVEVPSEADARWFTESYKRRYPGFNKYDGKTEKSQKMVRLGKDDYLVPEELKPSVVTADSNEEKITIPIDYFFPERDNLAYKVDTLRDVMRSMVDRDKKVMNNSLETLKNYNSAYRNPFIANPYYRDYVNYGYNRFDKGGKSDSSTGEIKEYNWTAFDTWAARHPQAMMRLRKAKTLIGDALALHPVLGIYDDIMDYINQKPQEERDVRDEINSISTALGFSGKAFNSLYGKPVKKIFNDSEWTDAVKKVSNILNIPDKINDSIKFIDDFSRPVNEFDEGGDTELRDTINPSVVSAEREGMSKKQIRKNSRIVRTVLGNLGEDGIYTPEQKKRMSEYIIRVQGGQAGPSLPRVIDMRKGLKYRNKTGVSGLERVLYSNEPIKEIIDSINSDHISYDPDGTKVIHGFSLYNYNGTLTGRDNKYDKDIVDSYINGSAPYDGSVYSGKYSFGPYKNYINRNYKGRDIKSYMFGEQTLPKDVIDRLDRYSYERGDNSLVVSANTDDGVPFDINGKSYDVDFDAGGHLWQFIKDDDGTYYVRQSDSYDFEPDQYKKSYGNMPYVGEALSALDDVGNPVLVFNPWKVATRDDLYNITNGSVDVNEVSDDAIKKAIEHNRQKSNGKFLNAIDNALTFVYGVTR